MLFLTREFIIETVLFLVFAIPLSIMDSKRFRISLPLTLAGAVLLLAWIFVHYIMGRPVLQVKPVLLILFYSLISSGLVLFAARVFSGNGLGFGDIFFGLYSALYCRFYFNLAGIVFAAILGVLYYLFLSILDKKKNQKILRPVFAIPFVPFLTSGAVLARIFFG